MAHSVTLSRVGGGGGKPSFSTADMSHDLCIDYVACNILLSYIISLQLQV